jgi:dGTPase
MANLASYASDPEKSRGRLYGDHTPTFVNAFQRDLNRVTRSSAFRRLENKTQVFVSEKGDHYRTRLTHSIEVSQVGRVIAQSLNLSTDLTEVLCLAHDLGHPPFGHSGESVINKYMSKHGGFNHNVFTLKLLTKLEEKYVRFEGLNLTWETLEGIVKHNGPLIGKHATGEKVYEYILEYNDKHDLELDKFPSLEAQVASFADDIAYNCHDLEDSLRAKLFTLEDLYKADVVNDIIDDVMSRGYEVSPTRIANEVLKKMTNMFIVDIIDTSKKNIEKLKIKSFKEVQEADEYVIKFSDELSKKLQKLRGFFADKMYPHQSVRQIVGESEKVVGGLFEIYLKNPGLLPEKWRNKITKDETTLYMTIADYIAGMTDRFAIKEYNFLQEQY